MKIVCDNKIPFLKGVLEPYAEVVYLPGKETTAEVVRDADALITRTRTICDENLLKGSRVKIIATATIGYDHIDTAWCESHGIVWKNAPGCNSSSVQQYIASLLCTLAKRFSLRFSDLTLGVVGVGHVGSKVARAASLLGMKVLLNDPPRARKEGPEGFVSLDEICEKADIITLHTPLQKTGPDATWHLFDRERISRLGPEKILINSSRGPVVDNDALRDALLSGALKAAALDTWEKEPLPDADLLGALAIATPHIAGYSADGKAGGTVASVHAVAQCLGLPLTGWKPSAIPSPAQSLDFTIDCSGKELQDILCEALLHTYDPLTDDRALRESPASFEKLRGDYPVRREPHAFTLHLLNPTEKASSTLSALGFKVV